MEDHQSNSEFFPVPPVNLLLVDDEIQILRALKRFVSQTDFQIFTANSVPEARVVLEREAIDIMVTDLKMPYEDGEVLLSDVVEKYPRVIRILLSGFADLAFLKASMNQGKIDYYLEKPWDKKEFLAVLDTAREQVRKRQSERNRIHKINYLTNRLRMKNATLVASASASIEQHKKAHVSDVRVLESAITSFTNLIELSPKVDECFASDVAMLANAIATALGFSEPDIHTVTHAGKLCELGMIGVDESIASKPVLTMNPEQRLDYFDQVYHADKVLMPFGQLNAVRECIVQQFFYEREDSLFATVINPGSRVLAVARDICLLKYARLTGEEESVSAIANFINKNAIERYTEEIANTAIAVLKCYDGFLYLGSLAIKALSPGMRVKTDLRLEKGQLLFLKGHELTQKNIQRLAVIERNIGAAIRVPAIAANQVVNQIMAEE